MSKPSQQSWEKKYKSLVEKRKADETKYDNIPAMERRIDELTKKLASEQDAKARLDESLAASERRCHEYGVQNDALRQEVETVKLKAHRAVDAANSRVTAAEASVVRLVEIRTASLEEELRRAATEQAQSNAVIAALNADNNELREANEGLFRHVSRYERSFNILIGLERYVSRTVKKLQTEQVSLQHDMNSALGQLRMTDLNGDPLPHAERERRIKIVNQRVESIKSGEYNLIRRVFRDMENWSNSYRNGDVPRLTTDPGVPAPDYDVDDGGVTELLDAAKAWGMEVASVPGEVPTHVGRLLEAVTRILLNRRKDEESPADQTSDDPSRSQDQNQVCEIDTTGMPQFM